MPRQPAAKSPVDSLKAVLLAVSGLEKEDLRWVFKAALDKEGITGFSLEGDHGDDNVGHEGSGRSTAGLLRRGPGGSSPSAPQFFRTKKPNSDTQKIACLAYYLTHYKNTVEFKTADLQQAETDSRAPKISNLTRAVDNATRQAKVLTTTSGGMKQLTTHGEDVVEALPDQDRVKEVLKTQKGGKRRKRGAKKKPKAK